MGSGFKVPYKHGDIATDVEDLGVQLGERFERFCTDYGRPLSLAFEPWEILVSEAGHFVTAGKCGETNHLYHFCSSEQRLQSPDSPHALQCVPPH